MAPHTYKGVLAQFMSFHWNTLHMADHEFSWEELTELTAQDVSDWMNYHAFGNTIPTEDDNPIHARSSSMYYWKKALSHFMPNKNMQWNEMSGTGNPTKSQIVNNVIKHVRKFKTHCQGAASQARQTLQASEYKAIIKELSKDDDIIGEHSVLALTAFQFHVIGQIDDCSKWMRQNLSSNEANPA